jgi:pyruvate/2-oxoglutarate dehydrogenase complex dihydrolipoamide acyltransferase (E2) component
VNAVIDDTTNEIVYRNYVDISVAVSAPTGLVVPVLRNTEKMNFAVSTDRQTMSYAVLKCYVLFENDLLF